MQNHPENKISEKDLETIAYMHIHPRKLSAPVKIPLTKFRFFLDKIKHFYEFDKDSIILEKDENNLISGILIYTHDEKTFNEFSGPKHFRFYLKAIKTITGFYGFDFKKIFLATKSMLGLESKTTQNHLSAKFAKIWVLIVAEEDRKKGIATKLLQKCIEKLKEHKVNTVRVTVKKDNIPAVKTYKKFGFKTIGECIESSGESFIMEVHNE